MRAKNAFGVESEMNFHAEYEKKDSSYQIRYLDLDGKIYLGTSSKYFELVRKTENKVKKITNPNNIFVIGNEVIGNYGKEEYIRG